MPRVTKKTQSKSNEKSSDEYSDDEEQQRLKKMKEQMLKKREERKMQREEEKRRYEEDRTYRKKGGWYSRLDSMISSEANREKWTNEKTAKVIEKFKQAKQPDTEFQRFMNKFDQTTDFDQRVELLLDSYPECKKDYITVSEAKKKFGEH